MRLPTPFLASLLALFALTCADEFDATQPKSQRSSTVYAWPLSAPSPTPLGTVSFSPRSATGSYKHVDTAAVASGIPPDELVRVGIYDEATGNWAGSVVTGQLVAAVRSASGVAITLRLDSSGNVWHVELAEDPASVGSRVSVVKTAPGPVPQLNRPIVLDPDGKVPVPVVEKTLLQKYWWVLLAGFFLILSGGGGGEE